MPPYVCAIAIVSKISNELVYGFDENIGCIDYRLWPQLYLFTILQDKTCFQDMLCEISQCLVRLQRTLFSRSNDQNGYNSICHDLRFFFVVSLGLTFCVLALFMICVYLCYLCFHLIRPLFFLLSRRRPSCAATPNHTCF